MTAAPAQAERRAAKTVTVLDPIVTAIERERARRGMTITNIAHHGGITVGDWLKVCNANAHLNLPQLRRITAHFGWTITTVSPDRATAESDEIAALRAQLTAARAALADSATSFDFAPLSPAQRLRALLGRAIRIPGLPAGVNEKLNSALAELGCAGRVKV